MLDAGVAATLTTMDTTAETFRISAEAAEAYEAAFVPAFFDQWVPHLLDAADVRPVPHATSSTRRPGG